MMSFYLSNFIQAKKCEKRNIARDSIEVVIPSAKRSEHVLDNLKTVGVQLSAEEKT